jgi:hypothetical protein
MENPLRTMGSFLLLSLLAMGLLSYWLDSRKPRLPEPPAAVSTPAPPASVSPVAPTSGAPQSATVAPAKGTPPRRSVIDARIQLETIRTLTGQKRLEQAHVAADALVGQLEPQARDRQDDLGLAYLARGQVYEAQARHDEALADYERAYFLWRDGTADTGRAWLFAYDLLTRAYVRAERHGEALALLERALYAAYHTPQGDPGYECWFHQRKVQSLIALKRSGEALAAANEWHQRIRLRLANDPAKQGEWLAMLAEFFKKLGRPEQRLAVLAEAARQTPAVEASSTAAFGKALTMVNALFAAGHAAEAVQQADALRQGLPKIADQAEAARQAVALYEFYTTADRHEIALELARLAQKLHVQLGQTDPRTRRNDLVRIGNRLESLARFDEALQLSEETLALTRTEFGPESREYFSALKSRGHMLFREGQNLRAVAALRDALAGVERLPRPDNDDLLEKCLSDLAFVLIQSDEGPASESEALLRRALALNETRHGPLHASSTTERINLASVLIDVDRLDDAQRALDDAFTCLSRDHALESDGSGWAHFQAARLHTARQEWSAALVDSAKAVEIRERIYGPTNFRTRLMLRQYVRAAWQAGEKKASIARGEQLLAAERADHGWTIFRDLVLCATLANHHAQLGDLARARDQARALERAREIYYATAPEK